MTHAYNANINNMNHAMDVNGSTGNIKIHRMARAFVKMKPGTDAAKTRETTTALEEALFAFVMKKKP